MIAKRVAGEPEPEPAPQSPEDYRAELLADGTMTVRQACEFTGLGKTELFRLTSTGDLPSLRHGKRRLIPKRAIVQFLASLLAESGH